MVDLLQPTPSGLYCPQGDFYVDPQKPVARAVVTHAHSDHARPGCQHYLASVRSRHLMRLRLDPNAGFQFADFGDEVVHHGVRVSFHPAGHILGSAQVRLEYRGQTVVVSGDYKLGQDPTCRAWEPVRCHLFITESTFGLPVYRWAADENVYDEINRWWRENQQVGKCSVLYSYAVGKSQRLLAALDSSLGKIYTHGAVEKGTEAYRQSGVDLPETIYVGSVSPKQDWSRAMVLAVPGAHGTSWIKRFGRISTAIASGWMAVRGNRRRRSVDRGFVLSDHVDWPSLLSAVKATEAQAVWVTHGYSAVVARYLGEQGLETRRLEGYEREDPEEAQRTPSETSDEPSQKDSSET